MLGKEIQVSVSVTDSPLLKSFDDLFVGLQDIGTNGVEITPGFKSRWNFQKVKELSAKYQLPITAIHQPPWSIGGLWFNEYFIKEAADMGIKNFVFHPLAKLSFNDDRMVRFLQKLGVMQNQYDINILLENLPGVARAPLLREYTEEACNPVSVFETAELYSLGGMTLDTSHVLTPTPHTQDWFPIIYPGIKNIHLSSFKKGKDHLPLDIGDLQSKEFVQYLKEREYEGLITLEIFYPKKFSWRSYDFEAMRRSIEIVKN